VPRKSSAALSFEDQRLEIIHKHQRDLRKQLNRDLTSKKAQKRLPGEENLKKNMAIFLKVGVPGISYKEISARIDETKTTVKKWFTEDPYVREQYELISKALKDSALELMELYAIEAVETLVLLMRFGSEKIMMDSAVQILDRIGIAKLTKTEAEITNTKKHKWEDQSELLEQIRNLPPDRQEEAISVLEGLQKVLGGEEVEPAQAVEPDEDELQPLGGGASAEEDIDAEDDDGLVQ
jgi:hypothetical protein